MRSVMTERVRAGLVSKYSWPKEAAAWVLRSGLNPFALIWNDMSSVSPDQARPLTTLPSVPLIFPLPPIIPAHRRNCTAMRIWPSVKLSLT